MRKIYEWQYPVVALFYVLSIVAADLFRPGVASAVMLVLSAGSIILGLYPIFKKDFEGASTSGKGGKGTWLITEDIVMTAWFGFGLFSCVWSAVNGMSASVCVGELMTSVLPMIFYYPARFFEGSGKNAFYKKFLWSVFLIGIVGFTFYVLAPQFYIDFLFGKGYISKADVPTSRVRMYTAVGSTVMGVLSVAAMCVSSHFIFLTKPDNAKHPVRVRVAQAWAFFLSLFLAFMSNQRSAMVAAILVLFYVNFLVFFVFRMFDKKLFYAECVGAAAIVLALVTIGHGAFMKVYYRLVSLPGAIGQRSDQWVGAANNMKSIWLGNGLGANGHRAIGYSEHIIADGGLAKLYVENGLIGTSIFIFLMLLLFKKGFGRNTGILKNCAPELGLIGAMLLTAIGSDTLSFAMTVPIFYFCVGAVAREIAGEQREHGHEENQAGTLVGKHWERGYGGDQTGTLAGETA